MEVFLTKHTEEQIWNHIEKMMEGLEEKMDDYSSTLDTITTKYHNTNPYEKYTIKDWRDDRPRLKHRYDRSLWLTEVGEDYAEEFNNMMKIIHDVRLCMFVFPEWEERFLHIGYLVDRTGVYDTSELIRLEQDKYNISKKKWEKEDAEFIAERNIYKSHQGHLNREQFQKDEFWRVVAYENKDPDYWTTCKWCIKYEQQQQEYKQAQMEEERILQESNRKYHERMRQEEAERIANIEYHTCDICDYRTSNIDAYDRHLDSKEHRVKQNHIDWFCESCNTQSRSKNEHEFHLKSTKHQARAGLVPEFKQPTKHTCECCNYETLRKDHYNIHMASKKHITNSSK
jgi:hypothetical protein